jgi:hypothetical protein
MGSLERRIQQLEELYHTHAAEGRAEAAHTREELTRKAMTGTLNAIAHIRRGPIDPERWRFDVEELSGESLFAIACYIAALSHMHHPDEERAREILEAELAIADEASEIEGAPLMTLISELERIFDQMQEEVEKRGA